MRRTVTPWTRARRSQGATKSRAVGIVAPVLVAILCLTMHASAARAEPSSSLSHRIDQGIARAHLGPQALLADEYEFARRIYLDLIGRIPSRDELQKFLSSTSDERRTELIDHLLATDECNGHLAIVLDVMLMERRPDKYVSTESWRRYLKESFAADKPFNQLAAEILSANGEEGDLRPAAKFLLEREVESHAITRDVSRMFLGRDVQCAQCHDHPLVDDYSQAEYYGVQSFLNRSFRFEKTTDDEKKVSLIGERAEGDVSFSSVFEPDAQQVTALPALPNGLALDQEPLPTPDRAYLVAPEKNVRPVPRFSRREQLAKLAAEGRSDLFRKNIANRLWRIMMKKGLIEPPDLIHSDNPATYPLLLNELSDAFAKMGYDVKAFLRQVAASDAYQRRVTIPAEMLQDVDQAPGQLASLTRRLEFQKQVVGRSERALYTASEQLQLARTAVIQTREQIAGTRGQRSASVKQREEATSKAIEAKQQRDQQSTVTETLAAAAEKLREASVHQKDDEELAAVSRLLASRAERAKQSLTQLDEAVAKHQQAIQEAEKTVAVSSGKLAKLHETLGQQASRATEESGAHRALLSRVDGEVARRVDLMHQIQIAEQTVQLRDASDALAAANTQHQLLVEKQRALEKSRGELSRREAEHRPTLADAANRTLAARERVATSEKLLDDHQQLLNSLRNAAEQVAAARDQLQGDADLAAAHGQLVLRTEQLQQQLAAFEQQRQLACDAADSIFQHQQVEQQMLAELTDALRQIDTRLSSVQSERTAVQAQVESAEVAADLASSRMRTTLTRRFVVASPQALSPEQLAASVICALNLEPRFLAAAEAEWQKNNKDKPADQIDSTKRDEAIRASTDKRRNQVGSSFVSLFASTPGSPQDTFFATVDQALFLANDGRMQSWIRPNHENLTARLSKLKSDELIANDLYLSILTREPTEGERTAVAEYLQSSPDGRSKAIEEMIWSLIASVEFRFNH